MHLKRRRRYRSHKLLSALIALNVVAALGGATDIGYVSLKNQADRLQANLTADLQAGQRELEAGKEALQQANSKRDTALIDRAVTHFTAAKADFQSAAEEADSSQFLRDIEYTPSVGQLAKSRHTAVDAIAQMGVSVADGAQSLSELDKEILNPSPSGEAGKTLLEVLDEVHNGLGSVRSDLQAAETAADKVDLSVVPPGQRAAFSKARGSIYSALSGFSEFDRMYPVLIEVLGGHGIRRYLIEQVNPAELRAGGGFIGTYSILQADHGSLQVVRGGDSYDLANPRPFPGQAGFIPWPGPFPEVDPTISWSFVDSNEFPDFAANAQAAITFAEPRTQRLDGVISIDYFAVAAILRLTGPLTVPGYGLTVSADNFVDETMRFDLANSPVHKAILTSLAGPLMSRIAALPPKIWPTLLTTLNELVTQRHMQIYFRAQDAEAEMDRIGWSGRLNSALATDYLLELESNYGGGKSNYFVTRRYALTLSVSGGTLHHHLTVAYANRGGCNSEVNANYRATTRLYAGAGASGAWSSLRPVRYPYTIPQSKVPILVGWLPMVYCDGGQASVTLSFDTPWTAADQRFHQIYWQKQPGTQSDHVVVSWSSTNGQIYSANGDLGQDRIITLTPAGVTISAGSPAQADLPTLSF